jgi:hypothetical protein
MPTPTNQFRLKLQPSTPYNFSIDWGDDAREIFQGTTSGVASNAGLSHTYTSTGNYIVSITENVVGGFPKPFFDNFRNTDSNNDGRKVTNIRQWGRGTFQDLAYSFSNCINLQIGATDHPTSKLNEITNLNSAWYNCTSLTSFPQIDTSNVTNFNSTWYNCSNITNFPLLNMNKMTDGTNCFNGAKIPTETYSQLLQNLAQNNLTRDVVFHAGSQTYYFQSAQAFKDVLTNTRGWIITDGGSVNSLNFTKTGGTVALRDQFNFFTNPAGLTCGAGCTNTSGSYGPNTLVTLDYNTTSSVTCPNPYVNYTTSRPVQYTYAAGEGISLLGNGILNTGELISVSDSLTIGGIPSDGTPYQNGDGIVIRYKEIVINMNGNINVTASVICA